MMRRPILLALVVSFSFAMIVARPASATWTYSGVPDQNGPLVSDNAGGVLVATRTVQHFDGAGVSIWGSGTCLPGGTTQANSAVSDGAGGILLSITTGDIYAGRVQANGTVLWGSSGVLLCNAAGSQSGVLMCGDGAGAAIVAWQDPRVGSGLDDIYAQRVNAAGAVQWAVNGIPICTQPGKQRDLAIIPDGSGGAIIAWGDPRAGESDQNIYAQHVDASGNALWAVDGVPVCTASGVQAVPVLASDGVGGVIVAWWDLRSGPRDVYAQRLNSSGAPLWAVDGIPIANGPADEYQTSIVPDGAQGAILAWEDYRSAGQGDIYAQRVNGSGAPLWTAGGVPVCTESHAQHHPHIINDGTGGVVISWADTRGGGSTWEARVQRLNAAGVTLWLPNGVYVATGIQPTSSERLVTDGSGGAFVGVDGQNYFTVGALHRVFSDGSPAWSPYYRPAWQGVFDEPYDQGGWVQLRVNRAAAEVGSGFDPPVTAYSVWRRIPGTYASATDAVATTGGENVAQGLTGPARIDATQAGGAEFPPGTWESVASQPVMQIPTYILAAPTHDDSTAAGPATDVYVIVSHTTTVGFYVVSLPDSRHSVDNLPPLTPQNAGGTSTTPGTAQLHWGSNGERDLAGYAVYKGASAAFVPSIANRLGTTTTPVWTDAAYDPSNSYYKISAYDRHGNASGYAPVAPSQITAVGPIVVPAVSFLGRPEPNPAHAVVTMEYGLSREGHVQVDILDVRGRLVRRVLDGQDQAGVRSITWEGTDDAGRAAPQGVYWVRLSAPDVRRSVRLVWLQ